MKDTHLKFRGVHPTAEPSSPVCIIPRSQGYQLSQKTPLCASHRGVKLCSVHPTAESSSAVCILPLSQAPPCESHREVKLRGVHHTVESSSTVCIPPQSQAPWCASYRGVMLVCFLPRSQAPRCDAHCTLQSQNRNLWESLVAFKETIKRIPFRGKLFYHVRKDLKKIF